MIDEVMLKEALVTSYDRECNVLEERASISGMHTFPQNYYYRMRKISRMAGRRYVTVMHRRVRLALVVAALIAVMIAATVTTIAIIRPQIFYTIKKGVKSWDYTFRQEDPDKLAGEFVCKKPEVPEEYELVQEENTEGTYMLEYINNEGRRIVYVQEQYNETISESITDTAKRESVKLNNGSDADLYYEQTDEGEYYCLFWNDGFNIYTLIWDGCYKNDILELAATIS